MNLIIRIFLLALSFSFTQINSLQAVYQDNTEKMLCEMLTALHEQNYHAFVQYGSDDFKKEITPDVVTSVSSQLDLEGYDLCYFGNIQRDQADESCWKLVSKDSKEWLIRFFTNENEVLGIFFQ